MRTIDGDGFMPRRATRGSAGYDFFMPSTIHLTPGEWWDFDSGVSFDGSERIIVNGAEASDWVMLVFPRSGLGAKYGVRIRNTVGVIDQDYRGRIMFSMTADEHITITEGSRYAQGVFVPFGVLADEIPPTEERTGGHGSTGA